MKFERLDDPACVAFKTIIDGGTAEIVEDDRHGLFLRDTVSDIHFLTCDDAELAKRWLVEAGDSVWLLSVVGEELYEAALQVMHFDEVMECVQFSCGGAVTLPTEGSLDMRAATPDDLPWIDAVYTLENEETLARTIELGKLFVGEAEAQPIGFIGEHLEGGMGLLHVLEDFRGKGYGTELECWMIEHVRQSGEVPYCHVEVHNTASLSLQAKLGLEALDKHVYWLY